MISSSNSVII